MAFNAAVQKVFDSLPMEKQNEVADFILLLSQRTNNERINKKPESKRIGIAEGQHLYDDNYDFDELNDEIAELFGM